MLKPLTIGAAKMLTSTPIDRVKGAGQAWPRPSFLHGLPSSDYETDAEMENDRPRHEVSSHFVDTTLVGTGSRVLITLNALFPAEVD